MKHCIIIALVILSAFNNETASPEQTNVSKTEKSVPEAKTREKDPVLTNADVIAASIAQLDMGTYIFRVHELIRFTPDEMQSKLMKWNDVEKDYYIIDGSIENKSAESPDTGRDMLAAYFQLSDGSVFKNILRGAMRFIRINTRNNNMI